jgi:hypothetical protein
MANDVSIGRHFSLLSLRGHEVAEAISIVSEIASSLHGSRH